MTHKPRLQVGSDPEAIREIFMADADLQGGEAAAWLIGPVLGWNSLVLLDGERYRRDRRLMMPTLHGERLHLYARTIREATDPKAGDVDERTADELTVVAGDREQPEIEGARGGAQHALGRFFDVVAQAKGAPKVAAGARRNQPELGPLSDRAVGFEVTLHRVVQRAVAADEHHARNAIASRISDQAPGVPGAFGVDDLGRYADLRVHHPSLHGMRHAGRHGRDRHVTHDREGALGRCSQHEAHIHPEGREDTGRKGFQSIGGNGFHVRAS